MDKSENLGNYEVRGCALYPWKVRVPSTTLNITGVDLSDAGVWPTVIVTVENGRKTFDVTRDKLTAARTDAGCTLTFELTQAQTLALSVMRPVHVQLRAKDAGGDAIASPMASVEVGDSGQASSLSVSNITFMALDV